MDLPVPGNKVRKLSCKGRQRKGKREGDRDREREREMPKRLGSGSPAPGLGSSGQGVPAMPHNRQGLRDGCWENLEARTALVC